MSALFSIDITIISLVLIVFTLVFVIVAFVILFRRQRVMSQNSDSVDVKVILGEFGQREKRLEQRLVEQRVKLEILELRLSKSDRGVQIRQEPVNVEKMERDLGIVPPKVIETLPSDFDKRLGLRVATAKNDGIKLEMLRVVLEGQGRATARYVQDKIGRSREHTARTMNLLFREGLVIRNSEVRPFSYTITDAGRKELGF